MKLPEIIFSTPEFSTIHTAWAEHTPFAFFLIEKLKPAIFVELGSAYGESYCAFCQAIKALELQTQAYAVDTFLGEDHSGWYAREPYNHLKQVNDLHFSHFSNLLCTTFDDANRLFDEGSIDLLHIDGLHTYEAVRRDFNLWLPKMSARGVIIFHDTAVIWEDFGVWKLMKELSGQYPFFEFQHGYGLGVLCTGKSVDPEFLAFLDQARADSFIPKLFHHLGQKNRFEVLVHHLEKRVENLLHDLDGNQQINKQLESEKLQLLLAAKETAHEIESLRKTISDLSDSEDEYKKHLSGLTQTWQQESDNLRERLTRCEKEKATLGGDLNFHKKSVAQMLGSLSWRVTKPLRQLRKLTLRRADLASDDINLLRDSEFFDARFYLEQNPDVLLAKLDPILHYLEYGGREGRQPSSLFDSALYLRNYPDVREAGMNPLIHYLRYGLQEGRTTKLNQVSMPEPIISQINEPEIIRQSGLFNEGYYLENNPDLRRSDIDPAEHFCTYGWRENRCPSAIFDTVYYLKENPDVRHSGDNPLIHYIQHGAAEGRRPNYFPDLPKETGSPVPVLFISGEWTTPGYHYRVQNYIDSYRELGIQATWTTCELLANQLTALNHVKLLIIWRNAFNQDISDVISYAREKGILIVFDMDDLMFDPGMAEPEYMDAIRSLHRSKEPVKKYCSAMQATANLADLCTGSTIEIADAFEKSGKRGVVLPNGYGRDVFEKSARLLKREIPNSGIIRIGYAGGTLTHQHDFALVVPALVSILSEFPQTVITLFGEVLNLDEFPELTRFSSRIEVRRLVPFYELQEEISRFDINLAPLEDTPFCNAKSELKFFEAALLRIPTVASPTPPFQRAISHGVNGLLASSAGEWYDCLRLLVENKAERELIGFNAFSYVRWRFGPDERRERTEAFLVMLNEDFGLKLSPNPNEGLFFPTDTVKKTEIPWENTRFPLLSKRQFLTETVTGKSSRVGILVMSDRHPEALFTTLDSLNRQTLPDIDLILIPGNLDEAIRDRLSDWQIRNKVRFNQILILINMADQPLSTWLNFALVKLFTHYFLVIEPGLQLFPETLERFVSSMEASLAAAATGVVNAGGTTVTIVRSASAIQTGGFSSAQGSVDDAMEEMTEKFRRFGKKVVTIPGVAGFHEKGHQSPEIVPAVTEKKARTILFIGHDDEKAGAQVVLLNILQWLHENENFNIILLLLEVKNGLISAYEKIVPVLCLAAYREAYPDPFVRQTALANRIGKADLIYGNTVLSVLAFEELSFLDAPKLSHIHELENAIRFLLNDQEIYEWHQQTNKYISCSPVVTTNLLHTHQIDEQRISTVEAFITPPKPGSIRSKSELREALHWDQTSFIVLGCGTINHRKGADLFLETAAILHSMGFMNFHFYWLGDNRWDHDASAINVPLWEYYVNVLSLKGVAGHVTFAGPVNDIYDYLPASDLFYLPSREDPFPLVCLEAAWAGIPTLCFRDSGGIPDAFIPEGIFAVDMEDVNQAAEQIMRLSTEPERLKKAGEQARNIVAEKFVTDLAMPKIARICHQMMDGEPLHPHSATIINPLKRSFQWVFITTNDGSPDGGSEKLWIQSAIRCREMGDEVSILIKKWVPEPTFINRFHSLGIGVIFKSQDSFMAVHNLQPDLVVISTGDQDEGVDWFEFLRAVRIPYVIVNHLTKEPSVWPVVEWLIPGLRRGYLSARKTLFTGQNNLRLMERRLDIQIPGAGVFYNPVDIARHHAIPFPADQDGYHIAIVGSLLNLHKGQRLAIEMMNIPKWRNRPVTLNLYGKGPDEASFRLMVKEFNLTKVIFHGHVQDIKKIWDVNHVLLMPSFMEGLPLVLVAAMMCGRVPVVTDIGAHSEVIAPDETGFIAVNPTVEDLDEALERAWTRRHEWKEIGQKARTFIHQYIPEDPVGHFLDMVRPLAKTST